jgi:tetratricopeptide (TPR) repeat protein
MKYALAIMFVFLGYGSMAQTPIELTKMGNEKMKEGNSLGAVKDYTSAIEQDPSFALAYLGRGAVYAELETMDEAILDLDKAIALDSNLSEAWFNRAYIHVVQKQYAQALKSYNKFLILEPNDPYGYLARAEVNTYLGNSSNNKSDLNEFLNRAGATFDDKLAIAEVSLQLADTMRCLKALDDCLRISPERADLYAMRGEIYKSLGQYEWALRDLSTALVQEDNHEIYFSRSEVYAATGNYDLAINDAQSATILAPQMAYYHFELGNYLLQAGMYDDAVDAFEKTSTKGFDDPGILYYNLGLALYNSGKKTEACGAWSKAKGQAYDLLKKYCTAD